MARLTVQNPTQHKFNTKKLSLFSEGIIYSKEDGKHQDPTVEVYEQLI